MDFYSGNIDQSLLKAYLDTIYKVWNPPLSIRIGQFHPDLDLLLIKRNKMSWCFITAWNPKSKVLSSKENNIRNEELRKCIENFEYPIFLGAGVGPDSSWEPEVSFLVLGVEKAVGIKWGQQFDQNAIVFGEWQSPAKLIWI